jgi:hypothetical protein
LVSITKEVKAVIKSIQRIVFFLLLAMVAYTPSSASETAEPIVVCDSIPVWAADVLPPSLIELLCTISDEVGPVGITLDLATSPHWPEVEDEASQPNPPEEAKQELLLWFLLWTQR